MSGELIDRDALDRIIHRAAELQTGEREIGDGLTEDDVLSLGADVGIPARYLKQAMVEERGRVSVVPERGLTTWLAGSRYVTAERVVANTLDRTAEVLDRWMNNEESLSTLRRSERHLRWERQKGFMAEVRVSLSAGGRAYVLTRADDVIADIEPLEDGYCHVRLTASLERRRRRRLGNAILGVIGAAVVGGIWLTLGFAAPVAAIPLAAAGGISIPVLRNHRFHNERVRLALERVLDRLERNELGSGDDASEHSPGAMIDRVANEIRKALKP